MPSRFRPGAQFPVGVCSRGKRSRDATEGDTRLVRVECQQGSDFYGRERVTGPVEELLGCRGLRSPIELGCEVRDCRLVRLDRVESGNRDRATPHGIRDLVARGGVASPRGRTSELVLQARAPRDGDRAASMSASSAACTSAVAHQRPRSLGLMPTSRAAVAISSGSSSSPPSIARMRRRRSSDSSAQEAFRRAATTARQSRSGRALAYVPAPLLPEGPSDAGPSRQPECR